MRHTEATPTRSRPATFAVLLALCAAAFCIAPAGAQDVDPDIEAQYDSPEMTRVVASANAMPLEDHAALVDRLRSAFDKRLLTPSAEVLASFSDLVGRSDAGVARVITRGLFDGRTRVRGGGAYFSFVTGSNDYNKHPDIELQQGKFSSGFVGSDHGEFALLDARSVRNVSESDVPARLRGDPYALYDGIRTDRSSAALERRRPDARLGQVYAVRSVHWGTHDTLGTFEVVDLDDRGVTIAWRRLRIYDPQPHPGSRNQ